MVRRRFYRKKQLKLIVDPETYYLLRVLAIRRATSVSELVRSIIEEWLESEARTMQGIQSVTGDTGLVFPARSPSTATSPGDVDPVIRRFDELESGVSSAVDAIQAIAGELQRIWEKYDFLKKHVAYAPEVVVVSPMGEITMKYSDFIAFLEKEYETEISPLRERFMRAEEAIQSYWSELYKTWLNLRKTGDTRLQVEASRRMAIIYNKLSRIRDVRDRLRKKLLPSPEEIEGAGRVTDLSHQSVEPGEKSE